MNRVVIAIALLSLFSPLAGSAQITIQAASATTPVTPQEAHDLMKSAHTVAQDQKLAEYFHQKESKYRAKASAEKVKLDQLSQVNPYRYQKYPRPVDWAKIRYESYVADADKAAAQAYRYSQLAATGRDSQQIASAPQTKH
jgi:hypothetical protein